MLLETLVWNYYFSFFFFKPNTPWEM